MKSMRGAALLLVLWLIALLTTLIGAFALTARVEALQGKVLTSNARGQEAARAGIEYAVVRLGDEDPANRWIADGRIYHLQFAGSRIEIAIVDESGKVDLNLADARLLSALMQAVGEQRASADQLASAIVDWRDADSLTQINGGAEDPEYASAGLPYGAKDAPFESVAEVEQVLGFNPVLFAKLQPFLTIHAGRNQPDPNFAQETVLGAMGLDPALYLPQRKDVPAGSGIPQIVAAGTGTYSIQSRAHLEDGRVAVLQATVRTGSSPIPGSTYTALRWQEGTAAQ